MSWSLQQLGPYVSQSLGVPYERLLEAFRPATEADLPRILELRRLVSGGGMWWDDESFVRWRYFNSQLATHPTPYWVFERENEIIGGMGLEPVVLVVDGEAQPATRTLDIMVRPDFDGRGLGALMNLVIFEHYPITLVTGSNARSHKLISRMFEQALDLRVWKTLVRSRDFIERQAKLGPLTRVAATAGDALLALERARRRRRPPPSLELRELNEFDDDVTALSRASEGQGRILVRRSPEYLNWRFVRNPRCRYRIHGGFVSGRLVGYVVTRLNLARPNSRKEGDIADWLALPSIEDGVSPLFFIMHAAVDQLIHDGARLVRCLAYGTTVAPMIEAAGFRPRADERLPFFVRASTGTLHKRLASGEGWFLTGCDFDVE
ncbi:MAG: GNAT family N-acetyltransferase [Luteitalea sp.]|nr:GNAT family N-acetyltransferase [Luteitalea sp.]